MTLEFDLIQQEAEQRAEAGGYDLRWEPGCAKARFPKANGKIGVITAPFDKDEGLQSVYDKLVGLDYFVKRGMEIMGATRQ